MNLRVLLLAASLLTAILSPQRAPELVVSVGHAGPPSVAAFADGHVATASRTNVALIDLSSGLTIGYLPQPSMVQAIEANPAGNLIAVGACGYSIQLWDVRSRTLVRRIAHKQECAESVSFSPDGGLLATGSYSCCQGGGLQIWDVRTGNLTRELAKATGIRNVVFGSDGRWLAGVDDKGTALAFEWPSGRQVQTFEGLEGSGASESAALSSPDGRYLAWLGHRQLQVWDMRTGGRVMLPRPRARHVPDVTPAGAGREWTEPRVEASAAEFLNDGRLAYVADDHVVMLTLPNRQVQELPLEPPRTDWSGHVGLIESPSWLRIRRDGLMLAGAYDQRTVLWEIAAGKIRDLTAPALTSPDSLKWSRSGLVAWADLGSGARMWNERTGELTDFGRDIDSASTIAFSADGVRAAVSDASSMHIVDVGRRRSLHSVELPPTSRAGVAFSPDGSRLVFESSEGLGIFDGRLRLQKRLAPPEKYMSAEYVAFSPDGRWIAAGLGGAHPALRVWPSAGSGNRSTLESNRLTYGPQPPAFSADSRWLASFSKSRSLMIWTAGSWTVERSWNLAGTGRSLAFAPQGSRLAVAADGEAAIWDASTGRKLLTLTSPGSPAATEIAWSPEGDRVVTSADDGVLRFWSASDGRLLASLFTFASSRDWLLVTPDGRLDGSEPALTSLVAWRVGDRVALNKPLTDRQRRRGLWRLLWPGASER